jgi:hypothetical protein
LDLGNRKKGSELVNRTPKGQCPKLYIDTARVLFADNKRANKKEKHIF